MNADRPFGQGDAGLFARLGHVSIAPDVVAAPAYGFDHFAHDARKGLVVELAGRRPTGAVGRPPLVCNIRDIDGKAQGKMGERMFDRTFELAKGRLDGRLACRQSFVEIGTPRASGQFRHAAEKTLWWPRADKNRAVSAA